MERGLSKVMRVELSFSYKLVTPSQRGGGGERCQSLGSGTRKPPINPHLNQSPQQVQTLYSRGRTCVTPTSNHAVFQGLLEFISYVHTNYHCKSEKSKTKMSFYLTLLCAKASNFLIFWHFCFIINQRQTLLFLRHILIFFFTAISRFHFQKS